MNPRAVLLGSLGMNLLLAWALAWAARRGVPSPSVVMGESSARHRFVRVRAAGTTLVPPTVIELQGRFHWSEVESPDYQVYVANLRALGCPERTIRDLVVADVNELFSGRVRGVVDPVQGRFWELMLGQEEWDKVIESKHHELERLDEEREQLFKTLLGTRNPADDLVEEEAEAERKSEQARVLDFLPPEKAEAYLALGERIEALRAAIFAADAPTTPEGRQERAARLGEIRRQEQAGEQQILTADELAELELRRFGAGKNTRFAYGSIPLTPEETRTLTLLERTQALAVTDLPAKSAERKAAEETAKQPAEAQQRQVLGEERFVEWQRSQQPGYAVLARLTERLNLPAEAAAQAYATRQAALAQAAVVRRDAGLAVEQKQARLEQLKAQGQAALEGALGALGYEAYRRSARDWETGFGLPAQTTKR